MNNIKQALKSAIEALEKESDERALKYYEVETFYQCKAALAEVEEGELVRKAVKDALEKAAKIVQAKIGHYYPTPLTDAVTEIRALIEKE